MKNIIKINLYAIILIITLIGCREKINEPTNASIIIDINARPDSVVLKTGDSIHIIANKNFIYENFNIKEEKKDETLIWQILIGDGKIENISNNEIIFIAPNVIISDSIITYIRVFPKIDTRVVKNIRIVIYSRNPKVIDTTVCFKRDVLPIIFSNCSMSGCHDAKTHKEGYILDSYANIIKKGIVIGDPNKSKIYKVLIANNNDIMPPPPLNPLTKEQIDIIYRWIKEGAQDKDCDSINTGQDCDTSNISYSKTIMPILKMNCTGCHNNTQPQGNIDLTNYQTVLSKVKDGSFLGSILHLQGFVPMPSPDLFLNNCNINQIKKWIELGAPNN